MTEKDVLIIPVHAIRVVNPRSRNELAWQAIVSSIRAVGLKKPIIVSRRENSLVDGHSYDLVCGQGRLEAFMELKEACIPAIVIEASKPDQHLMSLVENIARSSPLNRSLFFEIQNLLARGYEADTIAVKLGLARHYVQAITRLVEHGEAKLIQAVEKGSLPISVAVAIANGNDDTIQRALVEGYSSGDFRGSKLKAIRKLIKQRAGNAQEDFKTLDVKALSGPALVRIYKERITEQQKLVARADHVKERILVIVSAVKSLLLDEDFITVLQAENLMDMPEQLRRKMG